MQTSLKVTRGPQARRTDHGRCGAFEGCDAIFETQRDEERVLVLLSLLGRVVVANVPIGAVTPG